ncbi:hypothetical protein SAY87_018863 [Trapa incisa]|uniref:Transmembrane protein n=1 Tax=Trapa incisa TaxID=236973 RepID=A0AAN7Q0T4_9MYRT|nr:hypothetical protein SAY87_018863 [Trapa incisa]
MKRVLYIWLLLVICYGLITVSNSETMFNPKIREAHLLEFEDKLLPGMFFNSHLSPLFSMVSRHLPSRKFIVSLITDHSMSFSHLTSILFIDDIPLCTFHSMSLQDLSEDCFACEIDTDNHEEINKSTNQLLKLENIKKGKGGGGDLLRHQNHSQSSASNVLHKAPVLLVAINNLFLFL